MKKRVTESGTLFYWGPVLQSEDQTEGFDGAWLRAAIKTIRLNQTTFAELLIQAGDPTGKPFLADPNSLKGHQARKSVFAKTNRWVNGRTKLPGEVILLVRSLLYLNEIGKLEGFTGTLV